MRDWTFSNQLQSSGTSFAFDTAGTATTYTVELPDPLIDWLPYKIEKYLPTWHLMRSYRHEY